MFEIRMGNGSHFWTPREPTGLLVETSRRLVQLGTAANVGSSTGGVEGLRSSARKQLEQGQVRMTHLNPDHVASIVDLG